LIYISKLYPRIYDFLTLFSYFEVIEMVECLMCGEDVEMTNDCVRIMGVTEDGVIWRALAHICSWNCWDKFENRLYEDRQDKAVKLKKV